MTFKDELSCKAFKFETNIDIEEKIDFIKQQLNDFYTKRKYTISLIVPRRTLAIGRCNTNYTSFFVPKAIKPEYYRNLFILEFKKLGFTDADIELKENFDFDCDFYDIILKW